jgi:hypothetical protein
MIPASEDRSTRGGQVGRSPIESDHIHLRDSIARLDGMLDSLLAGDASREDEMVRLLEEFHQLLMQHLEREEESRLLEQAAEEEPRFAARVEALLVEHADLRKAAKALCAAAEDGGWSDFQVRFAGFCSFLRAHEAAENEVLMGVYLDEIGGHG